MKKARSLAKRQRAKRREQRLAALMGEFLQAEREGKLSLMKMLGKELASFDPADVNACYRAMGRPNANMPQPHLPSPEPIRGIPADGPIVREDMQALIASIQDNGLAPGTPLGGPPEVLDALEREVGHPIPRLVGAERDDFHERGPVEDELLE